MISTLFLAATLAAPHAGQPTEQSSGDAAALPHGLTPADLLAASEALLVDEPGDGRTWARAGTWKASFGPEGMEFIPFLGSEASRNWGARFDLVEASVGGEALALGQRRRKREGHTVTLERGALDEVYHLRQASLEQTFVLDELPGRGELLLDLAVETDMTVGADGAGGFRFDCFEGAMGYGAATAIDARGRRLALEQRWTGEGIQIRVPEWFVAEAALPLVVDPILETLTVTSGGRSQVNVDVAYEANATTYQIAYSELQSATDTDVISVLYNASIGVVASTSAIDVSSASWRLPANAAAYGPATFLCAAVVGNATSQRRVWVRTQDSATGTRGLQLQASGVGAEFVDVGGKGNGVGSSFDFMLVWQEADVINADFDIVAQALDDDGTTSGVRIVIDGDSTDMDRKPSISKSSGRPGTSNSDNDYLIVWERELSPTNHDIRGQVMDYTGTLTGHNQFSVYTFSDALDPDVSSQDGYFDGTDQNQTWLVAFERRTGTDYDIFAVVAHDGSADNAKSVTAMQDLDRQSNHRDPVVSFDGFDYLIAYQTETGAGDHSVHLTAVNRVFDGSEIRTGAGMRRVELGSFAGGLSSVGMGSVYDGGGSTTILGGPALVGWTTRDTPLGDRDVEAALFNQDPFPVVGSQYCEANANSSGNSAWMRISTLGGVAGAAATIELECQDLPPNQFGIFICSRTEAFTPNPGGSQGNLCLGGAIGRINGPGQILSSGASGSFALSYDTFLMPAAVGFGSTQSGETWYFQSWFRDVGGASNFSNGFEFYVW